MILTKELLHQYGACKMGFDFCEWNKLYGFDLSRIDEIKGDYYGFINWIKPKLNIKRKYDSNRNKIKAEDSNEESSTWKYDSNGNKTVRKDSDGYMCFYEYDAHNRLIKAETSYGYWTKYEYDANGNKIKAEYSYGDWWKWEYDSNGNKIKQEDSSGYIDFIETEIYPNGQLKRIDELYIPLI